MRGGCLQIESAAQIVAEARGMWDSGRVGLWSSPLVCGWSFNRFGVQLVSFGICMTFECCSFLSLDIHAIKLWHVSQAGMHVQGGRWLQGKHTQSRLLQDTPSGGYGGDDAPYEVWGSDQSNSVAGVETAGTNGSFIWIWDSSDIEEQLAGGPPATPLGCAGGSDVGPCDLLDVFPGTLVEVDSDGNPTGAKLAELESFGRLHGMLPDPFGRYVSANIFASGGGYVGIIDTVTKEAIALFRATGTNVGGGVDVRSAHMSVWATDGSHLIVANLNGKLLERIDVTRDVDHTITSATFNRAASLGVGQSMKV